MEFSEVMASIIEALNKDSQAVVSFAQAEAKGLQTVIIESDYHDGVSAVVLGAGSQAESRNLKDALKLVAYHSRAVIGVH